MMASHLVGHRSGTSGHWNLMRKLVSESSASISSCSPQCGARGDIAYETMQRGDVMRKNALRGALPKITLSVFPLIQPSALMILSLAQAMLESHLHDHVLDGSD